MWYSLRKARTPVRISALPARGRFTSGESAGCSRPYAGGHCMNKPIAVIIALHLFLFRCSLCAASGKAPPAPQPVEVGVASWNIEIFDAAGPADFTCPRRDESHVRMIAETILETGADVIGLQEVIGEAPLRQLLAELNGPGGDASRPAPWRAASGKARSGEIHCALLWKDESLELLGEVEELEGLSWGYRKGQVITSKDQLLFHRIPLAARFRVREAPSNDFTVIVLHLKAKSTGLAGGLDGNDRRRRGELESLLRKWLLNPEAQGSLEESEIIVLGDLNERSDVLVELLNRHGTGDDVRGRLIMDPSDFSDPDSLLLFTSAALCFPRHFTFEANAEKGQRGRGGAPSEDDRLSGYRNFIDHILISRSLLPYWDGEYSIEYFELRYLLSDHVRISDHRPVSIRLRFPPGAAAREAVGEVPGEE